MKDGTTRSTAQGRCSWIPTLLTILWTVECLLQLLFGIVTHDEGWYLMASRLVSEGQMPYLDFAYLQAPLLPYVYGLGGWVPALGIVGGRILTLLLGLVVAVTAARLAHRQSGRWGAALSLLCFVTSGHTIQMYTQTSNIPLSTALAMLGTWGFVTAPRDPRRNALAAGALALATAVRVSYGAAMGLLILTILFVHRHHPRRALPAIAAAAIVSLLCWGPSLVLAPRETWFNVFGAQLTRRSQLPIGLAALPSGTALFVSASLFAVGVGLFGITGVLLVLLWRRGFFPMGRVPLAPVFLGMMTLAVYLPNLLPGDLYSSYAAMALPFMAASGAGLAVLIYRQLGMRARVAGLGLLILLLAYGLSSTFLYLPYSTSLADPNLYQLRWIADRIAQSTSPDQPLFVLETPIAIDAGRPVHPGLEMSIFGYFPRLSDAECHRYHVVNDHWIAQTLSSGTSSAVILSDFDVALLRDPGAVGKGPSPARSEEQLLALFPELRGRYYLAETLPHYGEWRASLYIFLPTSP
jgi:hypothetical protein